MKIKLLYLYLAGILLAIIAIPLIYIAYPFAAAALTKKCQDMFPLQHACGVIGETNTNNNKIVFIEGNFVKKNETQLTFRFLTSDKNGHNIIIPVKFPSYLNTIIVNYDPTTTTKLGKSFDTLNKTAAGQKVQIPSHSQINLNFFDKEKIAKAPVPLSEKDKYCLLHHNVVSDYLSDPGPIKYLKLFYFDKVKGCYVNISSLTIYQ